MALSADEKAAIKRHLGYHSVSQSLYPIVEGFAVINTILDGITATPETETAARAILTRLGNLETQIDAAPSRLKATKVGSIELPKAGELDALWSEVKRWRRCRSWLASRSGAVRGGSS